MLLILTNVPPVCSLGGVSPALGGVWKMGGGGDIYQVALLTPNTVVLWRYGSVICEIYIEFREYVLVNGL